MTRFQLVESQQAVLGTDGEPLRIRPQSYQVFSYLLQRENEIVSKDELFREVWGSIVVTDDSLSHCISDIRRLLGPEYRELLQTVPKKGYRLTSNMGVPGGKIISKVEIDEPGLDKPVLASSTADNTFSAEFLDRTTNVEPSALEASHRRRTHVKWARTLFPTLLFRRKSLALIGLTVLVVGVLWKFHLNKQVAPEEYQLNSKSGPSIVVYPFKTLNQPETDYFGEGVSADTVLALNRLSNLRVLPFRTVRKHHTDPAQLQVILEEFNPQYTLTGTVWRDTDRFRLNIELTDSDDGRLLWSQRYDEILKDVFQLQTKIARDVATALSVNLAAIETERLFRNPTENMAAYDYVLIGKSKFRHRNRADNFTARDMFKQAIALDPDYVEAYIGLGQTYVEEAMFGYTEWPDGALDTALELARKAVNLDDRNAEAIGFLALVNFRLDQFELATIEVDRALRLNPNNPDLYILKGLLLSRDGQIPEAIESLEYARRYDPEIKSGWTELGGLYYLQGDYEKSILTFERGLARMSHIAYVHVMLAASYAELGKIEKAKSAAKRALEIFPFFDSYEFSRYSLFRTQKQRNRLLNSLTKAGLD